jgi:hypothetical protein
VDIDPHELGKVFPVEVGIVGDAKAVLQSMLECAQSNFSKKDWINDAVISRIAREKEEWFKSLAGHQTSDALPMRPERILKTVREILPRDGIIVTAGAPQIPHSLTGQLAEGGLCSYPSQIFKEIEMFYRSPSFSNLRQDFMHSLRPFPTRGTLPTGFVLEKVHKILGHIDHAVDSSMTIIPPEPIIEPASVSRSKSTGRFSRDSGMHPPEGPPVWTARAESVSWLKCIVLRIRTNW